MTTATRSVLLNANDFTFRLQLTLKARDNFADQVYVCFSIVCECCGSPSCPSVTQKISRTMAPSGAAASSAFLTLLYFRHPSISSVECALDTIPEIMLIGLIVLKCFNETHERQHTFWKKCIYNAFPRFFYGVSGRPYLDNGRTVIRSRS